MPYYNRDPKRDHNFDNHSYILPGAPMRQGQEWDQILSCYDIVPGSWLSCSSRSVREVKGVVCYQHVVIMRLKAIMGPLSCSLKNCTGNYHNRVYIYIYRGSIGVYYMGIMEKKMETTTTLNPKPYIGSSLQRDARSRAGVVRQIWASLWVAVKELKLSYYIGGTLLCTMYTHYGNPKP